jgi:hypothetical protein
LSERPEKVIEEQIDLSEFSREDEVLNLIGGPPFFNPATMGGA